MKQIKKMVVFLLAVVLCVGSIKVPTKAAETGTAYIAKATASYKHPVTGVIEDAGNNEGLGQSMTESVLHAKALIEKTESGKIYATVRIFLTDNISDIKFWTQKRGASSFNSVSATLMQENIGGVYCSDYRFQIPSEDAVVKASFYVTPMGRDVIFFFDFSNLKEGSDDFIVSVGQGTTSEQTKESSANQTVETATTETKTEVVEVESTTKTSSTEETSKETTKKSSEEKEEETTEKESSDEIEVAEEVVEETTESSSGMDLINEAEGLVLSDDTLLQDTSDQTAEDTENSTANTVIPALSWTLVWQCILIITLPSLIIGSALFGALIFLKKREED